MECKDCDRSEHCEYQLDASTAMERAEGEYHFVPTRDCPKNWQDKKVKDMTEEQCREAVKELRKKVLSAESTEETQEKSWKPVYNKPPLGCKPSWLSSCERIEELSEAIIRNVNGAVTKDVNGVHKDTSNVKKWATEILYQCEIMEKC